MALRRSGRGAGTPVRVGRLDVAFGLSAVVAAELEVWVPALGSGALSAGHRPALTIAALTAGGALIIRRAAPLVTLALVMSGVQVQIWLAGTESVTGLAAVLVALFTVGLAADRRPALLGLAVAAWWVLLQGEDLADHAFGLLLVGGPWVAGRLVRGRQVLLDELGRRNAELVIEQRRTAQLAVAEERGRIARDLHDVVAHSLTVMIVQAQAAEAHLASPRGEVGRAVEALAAVQDVGRSALTEARRLVGALAENSDPVLSPSPTLDDVEALVETVRATGLAVSFVVTGERRALPPGVDLTGYRVAQEALTNALRHAGGAPAAVGVTYGRESVEVRVADEGIRSPGEKVAGGRGLRGMQQRVESCGGRLTVETRAGGGFVVAALFPAGPPAVGDATRRAAR
jgi:signal transduction histidine kinase